MRTSDTATEVGQTTDDRRNMDEAHIVAINDDDMILSTIRDLLSEERYRVTTMIAAPDTCERIRTLQPSLLIVDLSPRSQAGWRLLDNLHADDSTARIPVIVTSTDQQALDRLRRQYERYGVIRCLTTPLDDIDTLLLAIRDQLHGSGE